MSTKTFTTVCPSCGNAIDVTLSEHTCATAVKRGATKAKAEDRLEALRKAGVNVANFFAMRGADGEDMLVRLEGGKIQQVNDDDPIFARIEAKGTIPNSTLYRRWVMSQMFHMLRKTRWNDGNFHQNLKCKGYEYMWKMTEEEFKVQARLEGRDKENFEARNLWFNRELAVSMCNQYLYDVKKYFDGLTTRKCKGVPYKTVHGTHIFVHDFDYKVLNPLRKAHYEIGRAKNATTLYLAFQKFNRARVSLAWQTPQYKDWQNAYKGVGAFYTMKSLILFHDCHFFDEAHRRLFNNQKGDLMCLNLKAKACARDGEGWRMLSALEKMIADNGIDIDKTISSWRKK